MTASEIAFKGCLPFVWVRHLQNGIAYYRDQLGFALTFELEWQDEDRDCGFADMSRDGLAIQLNICECDDTRHAGLAFFRLDVDPVRPLYDEFAEKGVTFSCDIKDQDWGERAFTVEDPDGNRIIFAGPIPSENETATS